MNPCIASRFLSEIPEEIIDKIDKTNRNYSFDTFNVNNLSSTTIGDRTTQETLLKFDFSDIGTSDLTSPLSEESISFSSGEVVRHPVFGIGRILEVSGSKERASVRVSFNICGTKHLMLAYAKLEKVK